MGKKKVAEKDSNEWDFTIVDDSSLVIKRTFDSKDKVLSTIDVTTKFWYLAILKIKGDSLFYVRDGKKISFPNKRYGVFYPNFSINSIGINKARVDIEIFASTLPIESYFPTEPILFEIDKDEVPLQYKDVLTIIRDIKNPLSIGISSHISGIGLKIKQKIDQYYLERISLSEIAKELGISSSLMSIYFKKSFYITPSVYRKNLRVISSIEKLLYSNDKSETVPSIAYDSGYSDLGRFYKQFKSIVGVTPGKIKK